MTLIGRDQDLARLHALVEEDRVLTLVGVAGVGKTSLALACAKRLADEGARAVFICDASDVENAEGLCARMLSVLGMPAPTRGDLAEGVERVGAVLALRPTMVVVDNFEHLVASCGSVLSQWIDAVPELAMLVTSREPLGIEREQTLEVAPLGLPAADQPLEASASGALFVSQLRRQGVGGELSERDRESLFDLLHALDGLPLAIELAASWANVLTITELTERMRERFAMLKRGGDASGRHASLSGALEETWRVLSDDERDALGQMTVFRGGLTAVAAEAVVRVEHRSVIDVLQSLRTRCWLSRHHEPHSGELRLALLQSVRDFAFARMSAEAVAEAASRHAAWYASFAASLAPRLLVEPARDVFGSAMAERDNLLSAIDRCIADGDAESAQRALRMALDFSDVLMLYAGRAALVWRIQQILDGEHASSLDDRDRAAALVFVGWRAIRMEKGARAQMEAATPLAESSGDVETIALVLRLRASVVGHEGDLGGAAALLAASLQRSDILAAPRAEAMLLDELADFERQLGKLTDARRHGERALALLSLEGDIPLHVNALITLTFIHIEQDDLELAARRAGRGLALLDDLGGGMSRLRQAFSIALGRIDHARGDLQKAVERYRHVVDSARALDMNLIGAYASGSLGFALAELGESAAACEQLRRAIALIVGRDVPYAGIFTAILAGVEAQRGHIDEAYRLLAEASASPAAGMGPFVPIVEACRGLIDQGRARATKNADEAETLAGEVSRQLAILESQIEHVPSQMVLELRLIARLLRARGADAPSEIPDAPRLVVDEAGRWFEPPRGARIRTSRRPIMRRMLVALAQTRIREPGRALTSAELLQAGWPDERILPSAAKRRLQVMLSRMRDLGLRGVLETTDDGYRIDPQCVVRLQPA